MPFYDDSGIVRENHRGPVTGALAVFGEQVERMAGLSIAWSATLFPAMAALAFPGLPPWLRVGMAVVSSVALVPATGVLYCLAARALSGEQIGVDAAREAFSSIAAASMRSLTPLYALVFLLGWTTVLAGSLGAVPVEVGLRVGLLLLLVSAMYWGPLLVAAPDASALRLLRAGAVLAWRNPMATLTVALASLVLVVLSAITVAGAVLAAPAVLALVQTKVLEQVAGGRDE